MTKKDFVLIASTLRASCPRLSCPFSMEDREKWLAGAMAAWADVILQMARELEKSNPRFDRERFITACTPRGMAHPEYYIPETGI